MCKHRCVIVFEFRHVINVCLLVGMNSNWTDHKNNKRHNTYSNIFACPIYFKDIWVRKNDWDWAVGALPGWLAGVQSSL